VSGRTLRAPLRLLASHPRRRGRLLPRLRHFERGFARVRCPDCATEFLLPFSCKGRGLCPGCGAERAAEFAAFLRDEVVAEVGHAQWVFTVPKLLRPYLMHHLELLGPLCAVAWQTVRELMAVAAGEEQSLRPGMVAVVHTFGDQLNLHPPTAMWRRASSSSPPFSFQRRRRSTSGATTSSTIARARVRQDWGRDAEIGLFPFGRRFEALPRFGPAILSRCLGKRSEDELLDFFLNGRERPAEAFGRRSFLVVAVAGGPVLGFRRTAPTRARPARLCRKRLLHRFLEIFRKFSETFRRANFRSG